MFIAVAVYQLYPNQMLQIRWGRWLTDRYLNAWLADRAYYRMQLMAGDTDNPDQRIADDVRLFVTHTLTLSLEFLSAVTTLVSFMGILWGLSGPWTVPGLGITIPGYMVWAALLYAILGSGLTERVPGRRACADLGRRERAAHRALGRGQEHTLPRHRRHLAIRSRHDRPPAGRARSLPAPEAIPAHRDAARGGELSDACVGDHG
jgi:putative ATP-binding cassette transporter